MRLFCHVCSHNPEVLWAQRSDKVYLTVALPDAKDISVKCEPRGLFTFSALGTLGKLLSSAWSYMGRLCQSIGRTLQTGTSYIKVVWNKC
ncbi:unnamed protein product [Brassica napus]|uniref:Co-chaperone protein p23 n=1 Tax=Brassica napus TaxID=3708 RepID=A0A816JR03_BRANA|nr:unnamed protein product [Brassica napus]